jgi:hypothetical protein
MFALMLACASGGANATILSIGLQEAGVNHGAITDEGSSSTGSVNVDAFGYGTFSPDLISASAGALPDRLFSDTIDTASTGSGTLFVYITEQDITSSVATLSFLSAFTANIVPAGWTVKESTYFDPNDGLFTRTQYLAGAIFLDAGVSDRLSTIGVGDQPYSVTELYTITADSVFTTNNTIDLTTTVPEPGTLTLVGGGLISLAAVRRRRKSF